MSVVVHHLDNSRSQRILWLLEELEQPYEVVEHKRGPDMRAPKTLLAIHPLGLAPVVIYNQTVLAESGAIIETLLDGLGGGTLRPQPEDGEAMAAFRFWLHYAEGSVMPPLLVKLITGKLSQVPFFLKPVTGAIARKIDQAYTDPQIARHLDFIEQHLGARTWLLGDSFSAADIQMGFPLMAASARSLGNRPSIARWLDRCRQRPAFVKAEERGGPVRF